MWVAICVPLVIGATALLMQRVEACLDRSQVGLATVAHAPNPRPPVDLDLDPGSGPCLSARRSGVRRRCGRRVRCGG